ncbi:MAG: hypothetical protein ACLR4Z_08360 [Butyricicoccaceae bacterium]
MTGGKSRPRGMGGFLQTPSGATASRGPSVRAPEKKEGETMTQKENTDAPRQRCAKLC